jgi:hypothetical protein
LNDPLDHKRSAPPRHRDELGRSQIHDHDRKRDLQICNRAPPSRNRRPGPDFAGLVDACRRHLEFRQRPGLDERVPGGAIADGVVAADARHFADPHSVRPGTALAAEMSRAPGPRRTAEGYLMVYLLDQQ